MLENTQTFHKIIFNKYLLILYTTYQCLHCLFSLFKRNCIENYF